MSGKAGTIGGWLIPAMLIGAAALSLRFYSIQRSDHDALEIKKLSYQIDGWAGADLAITEREYEILETRNVVLREYTSESGHTLRLFVIYSETNRSVFHPPEVCMVGDGVTVENKVPDTITLGGKEFTTNKLYAVRGEAKDLVLYCYKVGDFYTDNYYLQQGYFAINQLLGRNRGGATIRVWMALGEDEPAALARIKDFMQKTIARLDEL